MVPDQCRPDPPVQRVARPSRRRQTSTERRFGPDLGHSQRSSPGRWSMRVRRATDGRHQGWRTDPDGLRVRGRTMEGSDRARPRAPRGDPARTGHRVGRHLLRGIALPAAVGPRHQSVDLVGRGHRPLDPGPDPDRANRPAVPAAHRPPQAEPGLPGRGAEPVQGGTPYRNRRADEEADRRPRRPRSGSDRRRVSARPAVDPGRPRPSDPRPHRAGAGLRQHDRRGDGSVGRRRRPPALGRDVARPRQAPRPERDPQQGGAAHR